MENRLFTSDKSLNVKITDENDAEWQDLIEDKNEISKYIKDSKKPLIISTGLSNFQDIKFTVDFINKIDRNYLKKKTRKIFISFLNHN